MPSARGKVSIVSDVAIEFRDELDERAKAEGRSRSELIERACRFYLKHAPLITDDLPEPIRADEVKGKVKK